MTTKASNNKKAAPETEEVPESSDPLAVELTDQDRIAAFIQEQLQEGQSVTQENLLSTLGELEMTKRSLTMKVQEQAFEIFKKNQEIEQLREQIAEKV